MTRVVLLALLLAPAVVSAQDMPLFTFTKEGEGWVKAEGERPKKPELNVTDRKGWYFETTFPLGDEKFTVTHFNEGPLREPPREEKFEFFTLKRPQSRSVTAFARTADKGTVYVGFDKELGVWAFTPDKDNKLANGAPYAPLRVRKAYDNSKAALDKLKADPPRVAVTALSLDSAGRLYAATEHDLQVFDPTGRLSGVLTLPDKGKVEALAWEGKEKDTLAAWVGEKKWTRKMNPSGR